MSMNSVEMKRITPSIMLWCAFFEGWRESVNLYFRAVQKRCEFTVGASGYYKCQAQTQVDFPTDASRLEHSLSIIEPAKVTHRENQDNVLFFLTLLSLLTCSMMAVNDILPSYHKAYIPAYSNLPFQVPRTKAERTVKGRYRQGMCTLGTLENIKLLISRGWIF